MLSPDTATVVIACPNCGTRYKLGTELFGAKGRSVACAHCGQSWTARPDMPAPPKGEALLDAAFEAEEQRQRPQLITHAFPGGDKSEPKSAAEADYQRTLAEIKAAVTPVKQQPADAAARNRQQREFSARQKTLYGTLPIARFRRVARVVALLLLAVVVGGGVMLRVPIVQQFPQLAGAYSALGLGVNVVGLEFSNVRTLKSLQQGAEVLAVDGQIRSTSSHTVPLPQVIVTLIGARGNSIYEWSMTPRAAELAPGETLAFETQLTSPPKGATRVELTFANARSQSSSVDAAPDDVTPAPGAASELAVAPAAGR